MANELRRDSDHCAANAYKCANFNVTYSTVKRVNKDNVPFPSELATIAAPSSGRHYSARNASKWCSTPRYIIEWANFIMRDYGQPLRGSRREVYVSIKNYWSQCTQPVAPKTSAK